jgi:hypothetical protein
VIATVTEVRLVDDTDGSTAEETVQFGLDGKVFEIDLSSGNATRLRDGLAAFVAAVRRVGRAPAAAVAVKPARRPKVDREQTQAIREWARRQGLRVSDRGRISAEVLTAYHQRGTAEPDNGVVDVRTADVQDGQELSSPPDSSAAATHDPDDALILDHVRSLGWKVKAHRTEPTEWEHARYEKDQAAAS